MGLLGSVLIAAGCVLQPDPAIALMGCTGIVIVGGYLAFFHSTKPILFNIAVAIAAGAVCAWRVSAGHHAVLAAIGLWLVIELSIAVPLAIQTIMRTLGADVVRSDHDPLTGVLNRRAFYERATALMPSPPADMHLVVAMIDLDRFKTLNDTFGHVAGDQALAAIGWVLRQKVHGGALIGRFGGEEFIVLDAATAESAEELPRQLCDAIADLPHPVTASVGAALIRWTEITDPPSVIGQLIHAADSAMYVAKRKGGNQICVCRPAVALPKRP
ncbi:GGDEF domain-containing protein [Mycobacterium paraffinicum]|nr:GGDEF domain-containing protein [Mycobacterium paraffinicum]